MVHGRLALALLLVLEVGAWAQDAFEIQVYDYETAPPLKPGAELHVNSALVGIRTTLPSGELPTEHVTHVTLEPHLGLTRWSEIGFYLQTAIRPSGVIDFAGAKVRFKVRWPRRLADLVGLALNVEFAGVPVRYEADVYGFEIRPIVDLEWRRLYLSFNPILGVDVRGPFAGSPQFEPAAKLAVRVLEGLALGAEYYGGFGRLVEPVSRAEQVHRLFGIIELSGRAGRAALGANLGAGYGFEAGERWIVKGSFSIDAAP